MRLAVIVLIMQIALGCKGSEGDSCSENNDCDSSLVCYEGSCFRLLPEDEHCADARQCMNGLRCIEGRCQPAKSQGQACSSDDWCNVNLVCYDSLCVNKKRARIAVENNRRGLEAIKSLKELISITGSSDYQTKIDAVIMAIKVAKSDSYMHTISNKALKSYKALLLQSDRALMLDAPSTSPELLNIAKRIPEVAGSLESDMYGFIDLLMSSKNVTVKLYREFVQDALLMQSYFAAGNKEMRSELFEGVVGYWPNASTYRKERMAEMVDDMVSREKDKHFRTRMIKKITYLKNQP